VTPVTSKANKARGKADERDVAALLGGKRHPADVGGPEDVYVESLGLSVQVKGRAAVPDYLRDGMESARVAAAARTGWTGVLVLVDRSGTRLRRYVVMDLEDFRAREGIQ
jgi:hypothetical protein